MQLAKGDAMGRPDSRVIVACRIFQPELDRLKHRYGRTEIRYIDQGLHMTPQKMAPIIQQQVDMDAVHFDEIVLGYGLCANGIVGIKAPAQGLYVPRTHDCIAVFMGSCSAYLMSIKQRPGTFYLTAGWIEDRKDPLSYMEDRYVPKMGRDTAEWGMKEELKHYSHFLLIKTGAGDLSFLREQARKNADFFGKRYAEINGDLKMFQRMLGAALTNKDIIYVPAGERIRQHMFLNHTSEKTTVL